MNNPKLKTQYMNVRFSVGLKAHLEKEAKRRDQSLSEYVRELLITHSGYRRAQALDNR